MYASALDYSNYSVFLIEIIIIIMSLLPLHGPPSGSEWWKSLQYDDNILNKQARTADKEWSFTLWFGRGPNNAFP